MSLLPSGAEKRVVRLAVGCTGAVITQGNADKMFWGAHFESWFMEGLGSPILPSPPQSLLPDVRAGGWPVKWPVVIATKSLSVGCF